MIDIYYLFQLIALLNPDFGCYYWSSASVIANDIVLVEEGIMQFADQVRIRLFSQFINCISRVFQKLSISMAQLYQFP